MNVETLLKNSARVMPIVYAVAGIGAVIAAYMLYRKAQGIADEALAPVAEAWLKFTNPSDVKLLSQFEFSDGRVVSAQTVTQAGGRTEFANGTLYLYFGGKTYEVTGRNQNGNYRAEPL